MEIALAMAVIEEHKARTRHDAWKLTEWNGCDVCLHLRAVCKWLDDAMIEAEDPPPAGCPAHGNDPCDVCYPPDGQHPATGVR
jgi:hypothetical protein